MAVPITLTVTLLFGGFLFLGAKWVYIFYGRHSTPAAALVLFATMLLTFIPDDVEACTPLPSESRKNLAVVVIIIAEIAALFSGSHSDAILTVILNVHGAVFNLSIKDKSECDAVVGGLRAFFAACALASSIYHFQKHREEQKLNLNKAI